jgi:sugar phosphate isomerase/epimerase
VPFTSATPAKVSRIGIRRTLMRQTLRQAQGKLFARVGDGHLETRERKDPIMKLTMGCTTRPFQDVSFAEACRHIAAAGYTDVAIFRGIEPDSSREDVLAMRQLAADAGLAPSMLLARAPLELGPELALTAYRQLIDHAVALGADWLLDLGTGQEVFRDRYVSLMRQAAPYAQQAGIGISVKPHGGITRTSDDLIAVHKAVGHPAFSICYDPGNIIYYTQGAERPEDHISRVAPLVTTGIIKDCIVRGGVPDVMITPGAGWVDFTRVLSALAEAGFDGPFYLETVGGETIEEIDRNVQGTWLYIAEILARLPE